MPSVEDHERIRRSFWQRKLQAFYVLFGQVGTSSSPTSNNNGSEQSRVVTGEQWMKHETAVEDALEHFGPFYADLWTHLQTTLGVRLPPVEESEGALANEASRILTATFPEDRSVDAVVNAAELCRRQGVLQRAGGGAMALSHDRRRLEERGLQRALQQLPLWIRSAFLGDAGEPDGTLPKESSALLSSVVLIRCLFRRKLEAFYALVDDTKRLDDVDECMAHFRNQQRNLEAAADRSKGGPDSRRDDSVYETMVRTWMSEHNRALVGPGLEVHDHVKEADVVRCGQEVRAMANMWIRVQAVYGFFVPGVEVSPATLNEEISRIAFRLPPTAVVQSGGSPPQQSPLSIPKSNGMVTFTPSTVDKVGFGALRSAADARSPTERVVAPRNSKEAASMYKNMDLAALDALPTAAFVADYHYKRRLAKGTIVQTTKVSLVVVGIPFRAYRQLSTSDRSRVNECLVMDISALMSQRDDDAASTTVVNRAVGLQPSLGSSSSLLDQSIRSNPTPRHENPSSSAPGVSFQGEPDSAPAYEYFDGKRLMEDRRNFVDGIGTDEEQRRLATKSPFAPPHGGRAINVVSAAYAANVVVLPIDATIVAVQYHVASQGLEVTVVLTPTSKSPEDGGGSISGLHQTQIEEALHTSYLPRLLKKVIHGSKGRDGSTGAFLTLTEQACIPLGLTLHQCPSGVYHSAPRLVDVKVSISTSLNRGM